MRFRPVDIKFNEKDSKLLNLTTHNNLSVGDTCKRGNPWLSWITTENDEKISPGSNTNELVIIGFFELTGRVKGGVVISETFCALAYQKNLIGKDYSFNNLTPSSFPDAIALYWADGLEKVSTILK